MDYHVKVFGQKGMQPACRMCEIEFDGKDRRKDINRKILTMWEDNRIDIR
jgi:hypothetical protein